MAEHIKGLQLLRQLEAGTDKGVKEFGGVTSEVMQNRSIAEDRENPFGSGRS